MTVRSPWVSTSIVAHDREAGEIGIAVASKFLAVGVLVPWARANVGGIATQAWANVGFGPEGLRLLADGLAPNEVVDRLVAADEGREHRQLGVVDVLGRSAAWTGRLCFPWAGHRCGEGFSCQGNILQGTDVVDAMVETFLSKVGSLANRLLAALAAGQDQGGDSRGQQSAALLVVKERGAYGGYLDRYIDLRVDDARQPINELGRLLELHRRRFPPTDRALIPMQGNVVREVQRTLRELGYYTGQLTREYDEATRRAFRRFFEAHNFKQLWRDDDLADREVLNYMRSHLDPGDRAPKT